MKKSNMQGHVDAENSILHEAIDQSYFSEVLATQQNAGGPEPPSGRAAGHMCSSVDLACAWDVGFTSRNVDMIVARAHTSFVR